MKKSIKTKPTKQKQPPTMTGQIGRGVGSSVIRKPLNKQS